MDDEIIWTNVVVFLGQFDSVKILTRLSQCSRDVMHRIVWPAVSGNFAELVKTHRNRIALLDTVISMLKGNAGCVNDECMNGDTALHVSAKRGDVHLVSLLVHFRANVCRPGSGEMTPLHCAAFGKNLRCVEILLGARADPAVKDALGRWPEDWATTQQCWDIATMLRKTRKGKLVR